MGRIGVISDVHGNLEGLKVALEYLKSLGCDEIIHTGDVLDIGPHSAQCVELLLENNVLCIIGNHDKDFVDRSCEFKQFSHVPSRHKQYVFASVEKYRKQIEAFPLFAERQCGPKKVVFEHYCRLEKPAPNGYIFVPLTGEHPSTAGFDKMYENYDCDVVFFGHKHEPCDVQGKKLYVDVGSVGCHPEPLATGIVVEFDQNNFSYRRFALPYDQQKTKNDMTQGDLPFGKYLFDFYFLRMKLDPPQED